jgi:hypothetical protein
LSATSPSAVAPLGIAQAEDVAEPVLGHDPPFGERRHDFALRVQCDESFGGRGTELLRRSGQAQAARKKGIARPDEGDLQRLAVILRSAGAQRDGEWQDQCGQDG